MTLRRRGLKTIGAGWRGEENPRSRAAAADRDVPFAPRPSRKPPRNSAFRRAALCRRRADFPALTEQRPPSRFFGTLLLPGACFAVVRRRPAEPPPELVGEILAGLKAAGERDVGHAPRGIMEKNRTSPPPFLEMAVLGAEAVIRGQKSDDRGQKRRTVEVKLTKFLPSLAEVPSKELEALKERAVRSGFDFIDFWAADFAGLKDRDRAHGQATAMLWVPMNSVCRRGSPSSSSMATTW
jgi:hypothetical protein